MYKKFIYCLTLLSLISTAYGKKALEPTVEVLNTKGKLLLVTNIATKCGYTPQLKGLEKLYQKYKDQGLVVIGIPSNDFGGQTPESNEKVQEFCELNYGVTFPLTKKVAISNPSPLVKEILKRSKVEAINWNFEKFLFNKDGEFLGHYRSNTKPNSSKITKLIETNLND